MAELQDKSYGAYRWIKHETVQLIQRLSDWQQDANQILADSEIPDEIGRWRPRSTKLFIQFGRKPSRPLRSKQAGQAFKGLESPTCTCSVLRKPFGSDSFKRTACLESYMLWRKPLADICVHFFPWILPPFAGIPRLSELVGSFVLMPDILSRAPKRKQHPLMVFTRCRLWASLVCKIIPCHFMFLNSLDTIQDF